MNNIKPILQTLCNAIQNDQRPSRLPYQFNTFRPEPGSDFFDQVRVERRRKVREETLELYPNGVQTPTYSPMRSSEKVCILYTQLS